MQVTQEIRDVWDKFLEHGDQSTLSAQIPYDRSELSRIISGQKEYAPAHVVKAINKFCSKKAKDVLEAERAAKKLMQQHGEAN